MFKKEVPSQRLKSYGNIQMLALSRIAASVDKYKISSYRSY